MLGQDVANQISKALQRHVFYLPEVSRRQSCRFMVDACGQGSHSILGGRRGNFRGIAELLRSPRTDRRTGSHSRLRHFLAGRHQSVAKPNRPYSLSVLYDLQ